MRFSYKDRVQYTQTDGTVVTGSVGLPLDDEYAVKVNRDGAGPREPGVWISREFVSHAG